MRFRNYFVIPFLVLAFGIIGCKKDDGVTVPLQNEVSEYIWLSMNAYYFWQADVPNLSLEKYPTYDELYTFLNGFSSPETLFSSLLYEDDRFSFIVDDYEELEQSFQGISKSFGYELRLVRATDNSIFGYVKYVVPGSPADDAGLVRGDVFNKVNGSSLTDDNYRELLFGSENITLTLADFVDNTLIPTGETVSMTAVDLTENPILLSKVIDLQGLKVGYLVYNQFINNDAYHSELNAVFGDFINNGVSDLVLDLRFNPGGSVQTAQILASMIYGQATSSTVFGKINYNQNLAELNDDIMFFESIPDVEEPMNRMNLSRIFILTTGNTASASELIISGLLPYLDVTQIGTTTVGKNVGSITIYDSPNIQKTPSNSNVNHTNPNHTYAIQPIISQFSNADGFSDYVDGFVPDIEIEELDYLGDIKPLGDESEALLNQALSIIGGVARTERMFKANDFTPIFDSESLNEHLQTIVLDPESVPFELYKSLIPQ